MGSGVRVRDWPVLLFCSTLSGAVRCGCAWCKAASDRGTSLAEWSGAVRAAPCARRRLTVGRAHHLQLLGSSGWRFTVDQLGPRAS